MMASMEIRCLKKLKHKSRRKTILKLTMTPIWPSAIITLDSKYFTAALLYLEFLMEQWDTGRVVPSWGYQCSICSRRPYLSLEKHSATKRAWGNCTHGWQKQKESQGQLPAGWIYAEVGTPWQAEWRKLWAVPQPSDTYLTSMRA